MAIYNIKNSERCGLMLSEKLALIPGYRSLQISAVTDKCFRRYERKTGFQKEKKIAVRAVCFSRVKELLHIIP